MSLGREATVHKQHSSCSAEDQQGRGESQGATRPQKPGKKRWQLALGYCSKTNMSMQYLARKSAVYKGSLSELRLGSQCCGKYAQKGEVRDVKIFSRHLVDS